MAAKKIKPVSSFMTKEQREMLDSRFKITTARALEISLTRLMPDESDSFGPNLITLPYNKVPFKV